MLPAALQVVVDVVKVLDLIADEDDAIPSNRVVRSGSKAQ